MSDWLTHETDKAGLYVHARRREAQLKFKLRLQIRRLGTFAPGPSSQFKLLDHNFCLYNLYSSSLQPQARSHIQSPRHAVATSTPCGHARGIHSTAVLHGSFDVMDLRRLRVVSWQLNLGRGSSFVLSLSLCVRSMIPIRLRS